jgi:hypothetical protein
VISVRSETTDWPFVLVHVLDYPSIFEDDEENEDEDDLKTRVSGQTLIKPPPAAV